MCDKLKYECSARISRHKRPPVDNKWICTECMLLSENRWIQYALFRGVCFSFCLSVFLLFFNWTHKFSVWWICVCEYLRLAKCELIHTQSQRWRKREREIWRERAIHTAANVSTKMSVQQNDSTLFESFMSGSAFFFCNCTLCALLMIGSPIPLSFSFCRFSFIHPKNVYGRFTSFSFWPSPIPCSMLFTQFLFFLSLSLSHIHKRTYSEKKMMLMVMIHSNAYDHIVQKSQ